MWSDSRRQGSSWSGSSSAPGRNPSRPTGDSEPTDGDPATSPSPDRGMSTPRTCRSSRSGCIGMATGDRREPVGTNVPTPGVEWLPGSAAARPSHLVHSTGTCHHRDAAVRHTSATLGSNSRTAVTKCSLSVSIGSSAAPGATITRYHPIGSSSRFEAVRAASRSRRRTRLRTTADPTLREIAHATAGRSPSGRESRTTWRGPLRARSRDPRKRRKTSRSLIRSIDPSRAIRPTGAGGPCDAGP